MNLPYYSPTDIAAAVSVGRARRLLDNALQGGFRPEVDPARVNIPAGSGHMLLMPSVLGAWTGTKIATVSPDNPSKDRPRIQAMYLLHDTETLTPQAFMEGNSLTTLRTPAVSAVAVDYLAPESIEKMVVFGTGPQAHSHIAAMAEVRALGEVVVCGRNAGRVEDTITAARDLGLQARAGEPDDVADAGLIVCCTSAPTPLFDGALVPDHAVVVAMGSHEPDYRELDSQLMSRSQVFVEDRATALREAGDVIQPVREGVLAESDVLELVDLVRGQVEVDSTRPRVFKCVGMSWEDLAVAVGVVDPSIMPD
ncbi:MAG: ornithine cyclodeaminase family protein [Corynebacterium sp.]|uniref:ornithine cyclodeaminase family protein n=1 Tax=Corynebacterium sp. TaxID=1720 RepID=UPI0026DEA4F4|nr:ornithine cyclodeaminase family protein [Corynebacterium sp.]MDO5670765.1 ornithine cyclodeaminase family protein [Corynebacterium sp.]